MRRAPLPIWARQTRGIALRGGGGEGEGLAGLAREEDEEEVAPEREREGPKAPALFRRACVMNLPKRPRSSAICAASSSSFSRASRSASMRATTSGGRLGALLNEPSRPSVVVRVMALSEVVSMAWSSCVV